MVNVLNHFVVYDYKVFKLLLLYYDIIHVFFSLISALKPNIHIKNCCSVSFFRLHLHQFFTMGQTSFTRYTAVVTHVTFLIIIMMIIIYFTSKQVKNIFNSLVSFQYHGIMQMQVEDDTSPSRKGRKANIRVVNRGAQQQVSGVLTGSKSDHQRKTSKPQKSSRSKGHVSV